MPVNPNKIQNEKGKTCSICGEWKPNSEYWKDPTHKDGLKSGCRKCAGTQNYAGFKARKARKDLNIPEPSNYPMEASKRALERHMQDFRFKVEHMIPTRVIGCDFVHKKGLQFYREGGTMEGQERFKMRVVDGEYCGSLGMWNSSKILGFLERRNTEIVYEVPEKSAVAEKKKRKRNKK